ncbi:hypothetical protein E7Y32_11570 [Arthrobacter sp. UKPF54-2]|uniref:hypothetical protein n=1 Tax=Arthrobacter sp. UKPF54-2 TaxID=2600159 RepID=UPI0011B1467E|nr:hypothetical protein [Arthrobacter sp. UKPF54-2]QDY90779.1 hypothetical protein E7Y32_11570 [Arthrobacter sp. UKPF54-2]
MRRRIVTITVTAALCVGWYFFIALGHNATTMRHGSTTALFVASARGAVGVAPPMLARRREVRPAGHT